ncbi:hypothetical protein MNBD_GAMMA05-752 [hydrothermal vent metagenome]|uniref:PEP-CTERM protein-sorting domain-containing protein n=1 Tax=hydrothermal vent metagenome TaxID=652676 RepID=A0A3B0WIX2_9ZZZZ
MNFAGLQYSGLYLKNIDSAITWYRQADMVLACEGLEKQFTICLEGIEMENKHTLLSAALIAGTFTTPASAIVVSDTDLWNFDNGNTVTSSSALDAGTLAINMFGNSTGNTVEPENVIFANQGAGAIQFVEWQTDSDVTLRSFVLNAFHDATATSFIDRRRFSDFRLFAYNNDTSIFDEIFSITASFPYGNTADPLTGNFLNDSNGPNFSLGVDLATTVTTDRFRAEFVQAQSGAFQGSRILELDGFSEFQFDNTTVVPIPAAAWLFGSGLLGLIGIARRKKS